MVWIPYAITNTISVGLLIVAAKWPRLARWLFVLVFLAAGIFNMIWGIREPSSYIEYGEMAVFPFYKEFIYGYFAQYTMQFVLVIAVGQLALAVLLSVGRWIGFGVAGGIVFFIAIAPLGFGSAFPSSLVAGLALYVMYRNV